MFTQEQMKEIYNQLKCKELICQKKIMFFDYRIITEKEEITTEINGKIETIKLANPGDYILTGSMNEKYVLSSDKFNSRYKIEGNKAKSRSVKTLAKMFIGSSISFIASWGEKMIIEHEDYLINNKNEFYRIEKNAFNNTYEIIGEK